jgi:hypothetical protein
MSEKCLEVNESLKLILERRSITFFDKTKEVDDELLIKMIELSFISAIKLQSSTLGSNNSKK